MSKALYYIAAIILLGLGVATFLDSVVKIFEISPFQFNYLLIFIYPVVYLSMSYMIYDKYKSSNVDDDKFIKDDVIQVVGIISLIVGVSWLMNELYYIIEFFKDVSEFELRFISRGFGPLALIYFGLYYGGTLNDLRNKINKR